MMRWWNRTVVAMLLAALFPVAAIGDSSTTQRDLEINHLLDFIEHSQCLFIRNGTSYSSVKAKAHIKIKYDHVQKRVQSAEDFIKYAASRSSITHTQYQVHCQEQTMASQRWLRDELERYRQRTVSK